MASSVNKVMLLGRLTRDPELRYTPKGTAVCELGMALNRVWTDQASGEKKEEVTFVDVTVWQRTAEICAQYLKKGRQAFVEGRLQLDSWEDQQGQKRNKLKVVAENVTFVDGGGRGEGGGAPDEGGGGGQQRRSGGYQQRGGPRGGSARPASGPPQSDEPPPNDFEPPPSEGEPPF